MNFQWPQICMIALLCLGMGLSMAKHGEFKVQEENAWLTLIATLLQGWLMYMGGFFG